MRISDWSSDVCSSDLDGAVDLVEAALVDAEECQPVGRGVDVDGAVSAHLGVVAHAPQQAVGDARRAPGPSGDLVGTGRIDGDLEDPSGAGDDRLELGRVVVVEAGDQAEAVAARAGDGTSAGGGGQQREST